MCLTMAMFSGPWPVLRRARSSWKTTSSTQCRLFSTPQWSRTALAKVLASRGGRREIVAPRHGRLAGGLDLGLDHGDGRRGGEAGLARRAPVGAQPFDVAADAVSAGLDAAMVADDSFEAVGVEGVAEVEFGFLEQVSLVGFERQQVIGFAIMDGLGDLRRCAHSVDGDQGAFQGQALEQQRDGPDLVGFLRCRFLPQDKALAAGPGRDQMQRPAASGAVVAAPRRLPVNRHDLGLVFARLLNPGCERLLEQGRVQRRDHVAERVMARNASRIGQKPSQEADLAPPPARHLHEILGARHSRAQHQKQHLGQRVNHLPAPTRILQRRK